MGSTIGTLLAFTIAFSVLVAPHAAVASEALSPPVPGALLVRYGVRYQTTAGGATHRGLDLDAGEGSTVAAAAEGVVTFAGLVPADGGGRATAVTITTPSGLLVTVSPLLEATVAKGAHVAVGDEIGACAGAGDASSPQPHVHLSVRVGGTYVDPEPMLGVSEPASTPEPEAEPVPASQPVRQPAASPALAVTLVVSAPTPVANSPVVRGAYATQPSALGSPAGSSSVGQAPASGAAVPAEAGTQLTGVTLRALERAQAELRTGLGAGADGAAQAAHIAPEMLREKATLNAPHLSGSRTASMGVLLAAAAGVALWGGLDRRRAATAQNRVE